MSSTDIAALKRAAAARALEFIRPKMKIGLGTGSTADLFLELLAERIRNGLEIIGTPTSERTAEKARSLGIPMADLNDLKQLDLVVDGADEADANLDLIKGGGGALLREKIVAASADRMIVIADDSKFKKRLGAFPLPVEVVRFGHLTTRARIARAAAACGHANLKPVLRVRSDGGTYQTDNGNFIYDCPFGEIPDPPALAAALSSLTGVVEHGLFCGLASALVLAGSGGVRVIERGRP
jgi:ribose 5-phosphate isomerase A